MVTRKSGRVPCATSYLDSSRLLEPTRTQDCGPPTLDLLTTILTQRLPSDSHLVSAFANGTLTATERDRLFETLLSEFDDHGMAADGDVTSYGECLERLLDLCVIL